MIQDICQEETLSYCSQFGPGADLALDVLIVSSFIVSSLVIGLSNSALTQLSRFSFCILSKRATIAA